jgi:hypothetical protein
VVYEPAEARSAEAAVALVRQDVGNPPMRPAATSGAAIATTHPGELACTGAQEGEQELHNGLCATRSSCRRSPKLRSALGGTLGGHPLGIRPRSRVRPACVGVQFVPGRRRSAPSFGLVRGAIRGVHRLVDGGDPVREADADARRELDDNPVRLHVSLEPGWRSGKISRGYSADRIGPRRST